MPATPPAALSRPAGFAVLHRLTAGLEAAAGIEDRLDVLHDALRDLGWRQFVYGWSSSPLGGTAPHVPVLVRAFPANWDRQWDRHSPSDPYFQTAAASRTAVDWRQVRRNSAQLSPAQRDCIEYIGNLGLHDGLTIPVHVAGRRFAFLTALDFSGGDTAAARDESAAVLTLVAHYFDNMMWAHDGRAAAGQPVISKRERECLLWSAYGKTVAEIAVILGISADTVHVYHKRINQKLGAANRTHAVAKALHMGLLTLN